MHTTLVPLFERLRCVSARIGLFALLVAAPQQLRAQPSGNELAFARVVAHRGLLRHSPENTLGNFRACLELRLGFEFDVEKTKDGQLVCIHDAAVDRTTSGTGKVAELTLEEIRRLDAGRGFDPKFAGERVPTVDEVFKLLAEHNNRDVLIAVDLKAVDVEEDVVRLAEKHGVLSRLLFIGRTISEPRARERLKRTSPKAQAAALASYADEFPKALAAADADWIYFRYLPSKSQMDAVHRAGKRGFIAGKTVSESRPANWRSALEVGIDGILTDEPLELAALLRKSEARALAAIRHEGGKVVVQESSGLPLLAVDLEFTATTDTDLETLPDVRLLTKLYLHSTKITDAGIAALARCRNLQTLDLRNTRVTGATMGDLTALPRLQTLYLIDTDINDAGLRAIATIGPLEILNLRGTKITDVGMPAVSEMKLKTLNLTSTKVTDAGLEQLPRVATLETLYLNYTAITDAGLAFVGQIKRLRTLNLRATPVTDVGLKRLSELKDLQTLFLPGTRITDAGLDELKSLQDLQSLNLDGTAATDAAVSKLLNLPKLESLSLSGTKVTDAGVKTLSELKKLRWLDVRETAVTEAATRELNKALPECKIVR